MEHVDRVQWAYIDEVTHNRRFLVGLAAAGVVGQVALSGNLGPSGHANWWLSLSGVSCAFLAFTTALLLLIRRERWLLGQWSSVDAQAQMLSAQDPRVQLFQQEVAQTARELAPKPAELSFWMWSTYLLLGASALLAALAKFF